MSRQLVRAGVSLICDYLINQLNKKKKRKSRRWWVRPWISRRLTQGASSNLLVELGEEDTDSYLNHLRMTESQFNELLEMVTPYIQKEDTLMRNALPARVKLQIVLRHLATGDSFGSLEYLYRVPRCTISTFFQEVCDAIWTALEDFIKVPQNAEDWRKIMDDYYKTWNFPNCCGAMDGKLVDIRCPPNSGSDFYDYKKNFSIILLAIVDANYNFIYVDVGTNGRANDAAAYEKCTFNEALARGVLDLPEEGVLVADDAFPLTNKILKPYNRQGEFGDRQKIFNYRLSRARRVVENTFGIMVSKFRIYEKPIPLSVLKAEHLVKTTCALHNWLRKTNRSYMSWQSIDREDWEAGCIIPGEWRTVKADALRSLTENTIRHNDIARRLRNVYAEKFSTSDTVPWQWNMI